MTTYLEAVERNADDLRRLRELESVVIRILSQKGDDVCWRDVYTEMAHLVGVTPDPGLLPKPAFLANCSRFHDSLAAGRPYATPPLAEGQADAIRAAINGILGGALSGDEAKYWFEGRAIRWGWVERDIYAAVDAALGVVRAGDGVNTEEQSS